MTCFRASLNVVLEWYITSSGNQAPHSLLTKQWCKALKRGSVSLEKKAQGDCLVILP